MIIFVVFGDFLFNFLCKCFICVLIVCKFLKNLYCYIFFNSCLWLNILLGVFVKNNSNLYFFGVKFILLLFVVIWCVLLLIVKCGNIVIFFVVVFCVKNVVGIVWRNIVFICSMILCGLNGFII